MSSSWKQKAAGAAMVAFCLIIGLVIGGQALNRQPSVQPLVSSPPAPNPPTKPPPTSGVRVSQGIEPRGWIDLDRSELRDFMSLPGMTRGRAEAILEMRRQKPDLKPEDLLQVPGISQADVESWKPFLWERDEEKASNPDRR